MKHSVFFWVMTKLFFPAERLREQVPPGLIRPEAWCRGGLDCPVCIVRFETEAVVNNLHCGHLFPPPWTWSFLDRVYFHLSIWATNSQVCVQIYSLELMCLLADFLLGARLHPTVTAYLCVQLFKVSTATPPFFDMKSSPHGYLDWMEVLPWRSVFVLQITSICIFSTTISIYFSRLT